MTPRAPAMAPDERRASIIAATRPLLRTRGRAVSTKEIAKAAGIAEGTIFRVFESKDALIEATIQDAFDNSTILTELEAIDGSLTLHDRLAAAVAIMQRHLQGVFALVTVLQSSGEPMRPPKHDSEAHRRRDESTAELDAAFLRLIGEGADDLRIAPRTFIGYLRMLTLSSVHPMLGGDGSTPEELVDVLLEGALVRADERDRLDHGDPAVGSSAPSSSSTRTTTRRLP